MDILEHFGNPDIKDWGIHQHLGVSKKMKYKKGFVVRDSISTFSFYDSLGNLLSTISNTLPTFLDIQFMPSVGTALLMTRDSSSNSNIKIVRVMTGELLTDLTLNTLVSGTTWGITTAVSRDNFYIYNNATREMLIYNGNGVLVETIADFVPYRSQNTKILMNDNKNAYFFYGGYTSGMTATIRDKTTRAQKIILPTSSYYSDFFANGSIIDMVGNGSNTIKFTSVNYETNEVISTSTVDLGIANGTTTPLRTIRDSLFISNVYTTNYKLIEVKFDGEVITTPLTFIPDDIDDNYIYGYSNSEFLVCERNSLELVLSIPHSMGSNSSKRIRSNKGKDILFSKYK